MQASFGSFRKLPCSSTTHRRCVHIATRRTKTGRKAHHLHAVLVGKKNLEVRPLAVNKGEIVRRLMYENPDVDLIFCAGDDKVRIGFCYRILVLLLILACFSD